MPLPNAALKMADERKFKVLAEPIGPVDPAQAKPMLELADGGCVGRGGGDGGEMQVGGGGRDQGGGYDNSGLHTPLSRGPTLFLADAVGAVVGWVRPCHISSATDAYRGRAGEGQAGAMGGGMGGCVARQPSRNMKVAGVCAHVAPGLHTPPSNAQPRPGDSMRLQPLPMLPSTSPNSRHNPQQLPALHRCGRVRVCR